MPTPNHAGSKKDTKGSTATQEPTAGASAPTSGSTGLATAPPPKASGLAVSTYDAEDEGAGLENVTQEELAVPFVVILQKGSPQCEEGNPRAIPGAKPGMLMNTVSQKLYDGKEGIRFIPVHRDRNYIEWIPRDDGGGFVGVYRPESKEVKDAIKAAGRRFGKLKVGDNNDLVETCSLFGLLLAPDGSFERVIIAFSSTQIAIYKRIVTNAQSVQLAGEDGRTVVPPLFAHIWRLTTEFFTKKNYTWYKWNDNWDGADAAAARIERDHPLFIASKAFRHMLLSGAAAAAYESTTQEPHEPGADAEPGYGM